MITHTRATGAGQTSLTSVGCGPTSTGTATAATQSWNNLYSSFRRIDYVQSAKAGAVAGLRCNPMFARGSAGYASSGWDGVIRGGPAIGMSNNASLNRFFMGFRGSASAPTDIDPATMVNCLGVGWNSGDTNWQLFQNDASGTATKTDLGVAHPSTDRVNGATSTGTLYSFWSKCAAGGSSIPWSLTDMLTGTVVASGTATTDLPSATQALSPYIYSGAGGSATQATAVTFVDWTYETVT